MLATDEKASAETKSRSRKFLPWRTRKRVNADANGLHAPGKSEIFSPIFGGVRSYKPEELEGGTIYVTVWDENGVAPKDNRGKDQCQLCSVFLKQLIVRTKENALKLFQTEVFIRTRKYKLITAVSTEGMWKTVTVVLHMRAGQNLVKSDCLLRAQVRIAVTMKAVRLQTAENTQFFCKRSNKAWSLLGAKSRQSGLLISALLGHRHGSMDSLRWRKYWWNQSLERHAEAHWLKSCCNIERCWQRSVHDRQYEIEARTLREWV